MPRAVIPTAVFHQHCDIRARGAGKSIENSLGKSLLNKLAAVTESGTISSKSISMPINPAFPLDASFFVVYQVSLINATR